MSLINRLRNYSEGPSGEWDKTCNQAADRIEELERQIDIYRKSAETPLNDGLQTIGEYADQIMYHTEDKHISHYVDQIIGWCEGLKQ